MNHLPLLRRLAIPLLLAAGLLALVAAQDEPTTRTTPTRPTTQPGQWTPIFNGENLDGWTPKIRGYPLGENFADTFRADDGVLRVDYDGYENFENRFGHLFYETPHSHYRLRLEYRFVGEQLPDGAGWATANSGIMVHGQDPRTMALDQNFPVSLEVQLLGGLGQGQRTTANLCTPGTNVVTDDQLVTQHCINSSSETYHGDQWVTVELEVRGHELVRHLINGQPVIEYQQPQLDPRDPDAQKLLEAGADKKLTGGTISLQSESHPVEFRNIELMVLEQ